MYKYILDFDKNLFDDKRYSKINHYDTDLVIRTVPQLEDLWERIYEMKEYFSTSDKAMVFDNISREEEEQYIIAAKFLEISSAKLNFLRDLSCENLDLLDEVDETFAIDWEDDYSIRVEPIQENEGSECDETFVMDYEEEEEQQDIDPWYVPDEDLYDDYCGTSEFN